MSSGAMREAARRALLRMEDASSAGGEVTRVVVDVAAEGRTEVVTAMLRDGELVVSSTGGPAHVAAALELLAAVEPVPVARRTSQAPRGEQRLTSPGTIRTVDDALPQTANRNALSAALEDLLVAIVRVGVREARRSATVDEAIERIVASAPDPLPLGISRWIGMLRAALASVDVDTVGRILEGASQVAADLRASRPDEKARRRIVAWLGATADTPGDVERVSDRTLVELAREVLPGLERAALERRYLMCLDTGEIFREERPRGGPASVGPCPRIVTVGLGEVEEGAAPRRIRLLQYAVTSTLTPDDWVRIEDVAHRRFDTVGRDYRDAMRAYPGLAEPFVVVAPASCARDPDLVLLDGVEDPLPIARADEPSYAAALTEFVEGRQPAWVAGRLIDADGSLLLLPCAVGVGDGPERRMLRIS